MKAKKEKDLIKALEIYYENNPLTGPPISADSEEEWLKYGMDEWNDEDWIRYRVLMKSILIVYIFYKQKNIFIYYKIFI